MGRKTKEAEYYIRHILFGAFYVYTTYLFLQTISLAKACLFIAFILNVECVYFGMNHVNTHIYMLMYTLYQEIEGVVPYPFWHHYRNPMIFSMFPFQYRMGITGLMAHFWIDLCSWMVGAHPIVGYGVMFVWFIDYICHEYYHTPSYTSWNPANPRFVGLGGFFGFCEYIGFVNFKEHMEVHHAANTFDRMEETEAWIDFGMPGWKILVDMGCDRIWEILKAVMHKLQDCGFSSPVLKNVTVFVEFAEGLILFAISKYLTQLWFPELLTFEVQDIRMPSLAVTVLFIAESFILPNLIKTPEHLNDTFRETKLSSPKAQATHKTEF